MPLRMSRLAAALWIVGLGAGQAGAQTPIPTPPPPKPAAPATGTLVEEVWETALIDGYRVGSVHLRVEEFTTAAGAKILRSSRDLSLTVRRGPDLARIQAMTGTDETAEGRVVGVFMRQGLGTQIQQTLRGIVEGNFLHVTAEGQQANFDKRIPWDPRVVSALGEMNLLKNRKPKPGDTFDYQIFEPIINAVVTVKVKVEDYETIAIGGERPKLLRVSAVPEEIAGVQLPSQILWADARYEVRRSMTNMPGMGYLVVERSTQAEASKPINPNQLPDLMQRQSIQLNQRLNRPHQLKSVVYRITMPGDREPSRSFAQDNRQSVRASKGASFELQVQALREPPAVAKPDAVEPGTEYRSSNYFLTSDDARVKQYALAAVGQESDPWKQARRIEAWVHQNMKILNFSEAMAPAFKVAETKAGDCTEFSMLTAAMCRAVGIPSRTAIGLVYVDAPPPRAALLGFHMWTEVFVRGEWMGLDATLGQGSVGPAHLKITDAHWHDTRSMTPLLPLMRVMIGKPTIEVVEVK